MIGYEQRRGQLEIYFDRTAVQAWTALTSDAPVGRIRATVRAEDGAERTFSLFRVKRYEVGQLTSCLRGLGWQLVADGEAPTDGPAA